MHLLQMLSPVAFRFRWSRQSRKVFTFYAVYPHRMRRVRQVTPLRRRGGHTRPIRAVKITITPLHTTEMFTVDHYTVKCTLKHLYTLAVQCLRPIQWIHSQANYINSQSLCTIRSCDQSCLVYISLRCICTNHFMTNDKFLDSNNWLISSWTV